MNRSWVVAAVDFCIENNLWPFVFEHDDQEVVSMWAAYIANSNRHPDLDTVAAQNVLTYLLQNVSLMVETWRSRLYFYSSATVHGVVLTKLKSWLTAGGGSTDATRSKFYRWRASALHKCENVHDLYKVLGDAILHFMQLKTAPFQLAVRSKRHFLTTPVHKRCLVFVFFLKTLLNKHSPSQWKVYTYEDYVYSYRAFRNFKKHDKDIWSHSERFKKLPDDCADTPSRKRKTLLTPESATSPPLKKVLTLEISSSDED